MYDVHMMYDDISFFLLPSDRSIGLVGLFSSKSFLQGSSNNTLKKTAITSELHIFILIFSRLI